MPEFDPIIGRYAYLEVSGARNRVYFEEAGEGRPLLCLHTAGADSRQWRHLLCDTEVTGRWRVLAFDMPYHGRSTPPAGWWEKEYLLTTETYARMIMAFVRALELEQPVVLGCSMGGAVVLELASRHATEVSAVVGLEAAGKDLNYATFRQAGEGLGHEIAVECDEGCGGPTPRAAPVSTVATPTSTASTGTSAEGRRR